MTHNLARFTAGVAAAIAIAMQVSCSAPKRSETHVPIDSDLNVPASGIVRFPSEHDTGTVTVYQTGQVFPACGDVKVMPAGAVLTLQPGVKADLSGIVDSEHLIKDLIATDALLSDEDVPFILKMKGLRALNLTCTDISDDGLLQLGQLKELRSLDGRLMDITGRGLSGLRSLESLSLDAVDSLNDKEFSESLKKLPRLSTVLVAQAVGCEVVQALGHLRNLTVVRLNCQNLTAPMLNSLGNCRLLESVEFNGNRLHIRNARVLALLPRLKSVSLEYADDLDALYLSKVKGLTALSLDHTGITATGLGYLATLPKLREISSPFGISEDGIIALSRCTSLTTMNLASPKVTTRAIESLASLPNLIEIHLTDTNFNDEQVKPLLACRRLEKVDLRNSKITNAGLMQLALLPRLRQLSLRNVNVSMSAIREFRQRCPKCVLEI